jgi:hypothetical protein
VFFFAEEAEEVKMFLIEDFYKNSAHTRIFEACAFWVAIFALYKYRM